MPSEGSKSRSQSQSQSSSLSLLVELVVLGVQGSSDGDEEVRFEDDVDENDEDEGEVMPDGVINNARCVASWDVERRRDSSSGVFFPWPRVRSGKGGLFSQLDSTSLLVEKKTHTEMNSMP
jgi:hypothetical protein